METWVSGHGGFRLYPTLTNITYALCDLLQSAPVLCYCKGFNYPCGANYQLATTLTLLRGYHINMLVQRGYQDSGGALFTGVQ